MSPDGRDEASGRRSKLNPPDGPLHSLAAARDCIRRWRAAGGAGRVEVRVAPGTYVLPMTFDLGPEDSGAIDAPVSYLAEGPVNLLGGDLLPLPASWAKGEELIIPLPNGVPVSAQAPDGRLGRNQPIFGVFWNSLRLTLARWPNRVSADPPGAGWAYIEAVPPGGGKDRFICHGLPAWLSTTGAETGVHIFSQPEWLDEIIEFGRYDPATGEVKLRRPASYPLVPGARFCIQNSRAALDAPGEWWFDSGKREIHVIAPEARKPATRIFVSRLPTLLKMHGVRHVVIAGFTWEGSTREAVLLSDVADCEFTGNRIGLTGGWGLVAQATGPLVVTGNSIYSTGLGGIKLSGGDRRTLSASQITANDNDLTDLGQLLDCYMAAFSLEGVGITIAHNRISHLPHTAILFSGNNHRITCNLIEDVCRETNDVGAIYAGRDWSSRGTVIAGNVFRQIPGWHLAGPAPRGGSGEQAARYAPGGLAHAIYLDDLLENSVIRGNVFADIQSAAIHLGGGSYHTITGNYFVRDRVGLFISERASYEVPLERLKPFRATGSAYLTAYPEIKGRELRDPLIPSEIRMEDNHFIDVPQPYKINALSRQNTFVGNIFHGQFPEISASLRQGGKREMLKTWPEWQAAGFDTEAVPGRNIGLVEQQAMDAIIKEAGPRSAGAFNP